MSFTYRKANFKDIERLIEAQNKSFYDDYIKYNECPAYNESIEAMDRYINKCIVYVIEYNGEIVGADYPIRKHQKSLFL